MKTYRVQHFGGVGASRYEPSARHETRASSRRRDGFRDFIVGASATPDHFSYCMLEGVQSLLRYYREPDYRCCIRGAAGLFPASNFATWLIEQLYGVRLPVQSGFSVAKMIFAVAGLSDRIVLIEESNNDDGSHLEPRLHDVRRLGLRDAATSSTALRECIDFIEANAPFRYCLLAVRSPWQELIAGLLQSRGRAKGLALCVGTSTA